MSCLGECLDLGPPPDSILFLPPPPAPSILLHSLPELQLNTTPCSASQLCDAWGPSNKFPDSDFVELPRKEAESWSALDDTWLLVLIASSIGVLLLGALLAMFLLKCREMNMFGSSDCSLHSREPRPMKIHEQRDCNSSNGISGSKIIHPNDPNLYNGNVGLQDNRMMWAALTPGGGTQHFISENYPKDFVDYREADDHYETIDNLTIKPAIPPNPPAYQTYHKVLPYQPTTEKSSFENTGFLDYEYEEPMPLIKSYQYNGMEDYQYTLPGGNTDMRCISMAYASNTMRRHVPIPRPRVSSPTRIEHPNLPPLNLYPLKSSTLKRNNTLSYRNVDTGTLPKYAC